MEAILALDEGTTSTRAFLVDTKLAVLAQAQVEFEQYFPQPGWVEHDPDEIWRAVLKTVKKLTTKGKVTIVGIGITNQRETVCFWERSTGKALGRAIVWQDRRTAETCDTLRAKGMEPYFQERTGLLLDPYFSGTKIAWALQNWPDVKAAHKRGDLAVGTIDTFLINRLTGGTAHVTEPSNASRSLCFHLQQARWDPEACQTLGVPMEILPEVLPSNEKFGVTDGVPGIKDGTPITGVLGDQQAALFGQACFDPGAAKCTYGTGSFMLLNTGNRLARSRHRLISTIAWSFLGERTTYALEGSAFIAGAAVQWARDGLGIIRESSEIEKLAMSVKSSEGVVFVPALTGLGAPHWASSATGLLSGITRGTGRGHIARAILEGIAFQNADILQAMQKDFGQPIAAVLVDGGACKNDLLMQFQADVLGVELRRPKQIETTVMGAVFAAGLGCGVWTDRESIKKAWKKDRSFTPEISEKDREKLLKGWNAAVKMAKGSNAS